MQQQFACFADKDAQRLDLLNTIAHQADALLEEYYSLAREDAVSTTYHNLKEALKKLAEINRNPA